MPVFLVDRNLPGMTLDQLAGAQRAAIETSEKFTNDGKIVEALDLTPAKTS